MRYLLGQIAEEQKQWPQAIKWYESDQGRATTSCRRACAPPTRMAKQGKVDEARAFLRRVGRRASRTSEVQLIVAEAQLLRDANRHRDAFELLGEALDKQPDQPELLYDYALTAEKLERFDVLEAQPAQADPGASPTTRTPTTRSAIRSPSATCACRKRAS